jgi:hypothetical protein
MGFSPYQTGGGHHDTSKLPATEVAPEPGSGAGTDFERATQFERDKLKVHNFERR